MHLAIIHDMQGNVEAVAASPPGSPLARVEMRPGQRMLELDAPELSDDLPSEVMDERLSDLVANYRVDQIESVTGRLTRKPDAPAE